MAKQPLSPATRSRLNSLFSHADRDEAEQLLVELCSLNLPGSEDATSTLLERVRFGALKLSEGQTSMLCSAIELANTDWRDLLVAAGFADDVNEHLSWFPGDAAD